MFYLLVSYTKRPLEDLPDKAIYGVMKLLLIIFSIVDWGQGIHANELISQSAAAPGKTSLSSAYGLKWENGFSAPGAVDLSA